MWRILPDTLIKSLVRFCKGRSLSFFAQLMVLERVQLAPTYCAADLLYVHFILSINAESESLSFYDQRDVMESHTPDLYKLIKFV